MIILPVKNEQGQTLLMICLTRDVIDRLAAGKSCDLVSPQIEQYTGVAGVALRFDEDLNGSVARVRKLVPGLAMELVEVDHTTGGLR